MTEPVHALQRAAQNKLPPLTPDTAVEAANGFGPGRHYGTLHVITWEAPFATPEARAEADEINRQISGLGHVFRGVADWGLAAYDGVSVARLQPGHLVRLFKNVTDGAIEWQGEIDYDFGEYRHGYQKGLDPREWAGMFRAERPARLERGGRVIFGSLLAHNESGTEGDIWSLTDYANTGGYGLVVLQPGDRLTVYNTVRNGDVEWEGVLKFGADALTEGLDNVTKNGWTEIMRETEHMDTGKWLELSRQGRPAVVTVLPPGPTPPPLP